MFLWRNVANYPRIIPGTPSYLELCVMLNHSALQQKYLHHTIQNEIQGTDHNAIHGFTHTCTHTNTMKERNK